MHRSTRWLPLALLALAAACKKDEPPAEDTGIEVCTVGDDATCGVGLVCEEVEGDEPACFAPMVVEGRVFDTSDDAGIAGALVVARDANGAALSAVATTADDGTYALPVPSKRDADGRPIGEAFTLRADAAGYLTFPKAPRSALPLDPADAEAGDEVDVLKGAAADIGLIGLEDPSAYGIVTGTVGGDRAGGTLVVAGGGTGVADRDGSFVVFNVSPGSHTVAGYQKGVQLDTETVDVTAGETTEGVTLDVVGDATGVVDGTVQIVNAPGGAVTSVILVLEDTFDATAIRGEAPPGLRAGDITGDWSIEGVPDGRYVVLAAFENDDLVRDPDTSIGGTDIVHIEVSGDQQTVEGFKVTEALEVYGPGADAPELVSAPVTLSWADDSSEDSYDVVVTDALGEIVWQTSGAFDPGGSKPVEVAYEGPLESGMVYQFRATSLKDGVPLSTTEDLRGVFQAE